MPKVIDREIVIVVNGGAIQDVIGLPKGTRLIVKDYDTDGMDSENLRADEDGDEYQEIIYEGGE